MKKIRIGILAPSEIALRRFLPALKKNEKFEYVGVSIASEKEWFGSDNNLDTVFVETERLKAQIFVDSFGGGIYEGYLNFVKSGVIDAIYIPLPPSLHYCWAKTALEHNLHVLIEKPSTTRLNDTKELIQIAQEKNMALHENYMFVFHSQLEYVRNIIINNALGEIRMININFGFPFRGSNDFRYKKDMGGGALFDCGGYTLKLAKLLLGDTAFVVFSHLGYKNNIEVDLYGSGTLINDEGLISNIAFGMDNAYKCDLDIWGSKGKLFTNRILTAPEGFKPTMQLTLDGIEQLIILEADDSFKKSIEYFYECIKNKETRNMAYYDIYIQSKLVEEFIAKVKEKNKWGPKLRI